MRNRGNSSKSGSKNSRKASSQYDFSEDNFQTPRAKSAKNHGNFGSAQSVMLSTFQNHPDECLCKECLCGRHLCKFASPTPSMTLASTYKRHYPPRTPYRHQQAQRPASAKLPQSPLLSGKSTYLDQYPGKRGDSLERPKPEDLLKKNGGVGNLTFYQQQFPGHKGKNQYVPMNPELARGGLDFCGGSTYSKQFGHHKSPSLESARPPDQFRMNGSWLGDSSYKDQYQNPKNHVSKDKKPKQKEVQSPAMTKSTISSGNPASHFKTTYGTDFKGNKRTICPAAIKAFEIEQSMNKSSLKENSHFKGIDSKYTSLAKHGKQF